MWSTKWASSTQVVGTVSSLAGLFVNFDLLASLPTRRPERSSRLIARVFARQRLHQLSLKRHARLLQRGGSWQSADRWSLGVSPP
jgi:hypothetical protein